MRVWRAVRGDGLSPWYSPRGECSRLGIRPVHGTSTHADQVGHLIADCWSQLRADLEDSLNVLQIKLCQLHVFKLFGNKTKSVMVCEIVETVESLKKNIKFEDNVTTKDGFWGQVCSSLDIPNTKSNRYNLQRSFNKHQESPSHLSSADSDTAEDDHGHKSPEQLQPESPSLPSSADSDTADDDHGHKSPEQLQPESPSLPSSADSDTADDDHGHKSPEQLQPESPSLPSSADSDTADDDHGHKSPEQLQPESPSLPSSADSDTADDDHGHKSPEQLQPESPSLPSSADSDTADDDHGHKSPEQLQPESPSLPSSADSDTADDDHGHKSPEQLQPESPSLPSSVDSDTADDDHGHKSPEQLQPESPSLPSSADSDTADDDHGHKSPEQLQPESPSLPSSADSDTADDDHGHKSPEQHQQESPSLLSSVDSDKADNDHGHKSPEQGSMIDASDEDGFLKLSLPKNPSFFFVKQNEWDELKKHRKKRGFKGLQWTNVFAKGLRTIHPYCSFAFKRHRLKGLGIKKGGPDFSCEGYCIFEDCPVTFAVTMHNEKDLKATVEFHGPQAIHNRTELKRRPVRAQERNLLGQELQRHLPRAMFLEKLIGIPEDVMKSGCRDEAPSPSVLKTISWDVRRRSRQHSNEIISLQIMLQKKTNSPDEVLQKIMLHPKGVLLWSNRSIQIYQERCKEDIVYLDATGSIMQKEKGSPPYYVYELVVRNPHKGSSPLPVATYLTCDHTTASVTYFLEAFQTDVARCFGRKRMRSPIMILCDGSMVLMQAICLTFARKNLTDTINHYYTIADGRGREEDFKVPILHRCLSHIMKNAKEMCRKYASNHYHLAMHVFGALTTASTLQELDDMVESAAVVFSSPNSGPNVERYFKNLQLWLQKTGTPLDVTSKSNSDAENLKDIGGLNRFAERCKGVISNAPLDKCGEPNIYYCKGLIHHLERYLLPYAGLWSGIMLGDLGRHGTGPQYVQSSKRYDVLTKLPRQNITGDNRTQGIMEKSQWDLKHIRFTSGRLSRLDDFVARYQMSHTALLREHDDCRREFLRKTHRVEQEKWKERQQKKRGRYVTPISKPFLFKTPNKKGRVGEKSSPQNNSKLQEAHPDILEGMAEVCGENLIKHQEPSKTTTTTLQDKGPVEKQKSSPQNSSLLQEANPEILDGMSEVCGENVTKHQELSDKSTTLQNKLTSLWKSKKKKTEIVVAVIPTHDIGQTILIRQTELRTLRPHRWLNGEVMQGLFHVNANQLQMDNSLYILNYFTTWVMMFGTSSQVERQSLSKVNLDDYQGVISFVNISRSHWKLLYINEANHTVYLIDPSRNSMEMAESNHAAQKFSEFLEKRANVHGNVRWDSIKWRGGVLTHPFQQDGSSCGVLVVLMAREIIRMFPAIPEIHFGTSKKEMANQRESMGVQILQASVFDETTNCSMCSLTKPVRSSGPLTNWIQCDTCDRWYHESCLGMSKKALKRARANPWNCIVCS